MLRLLPAALLLAAVVGGACSDGSEEPPGDSVATEARPDAFSGPSGPVLPSPTAAPSVVTLGSVLWPLDKGDSLSALFEGYDVIVGRVTEVALPFDPRPGYDGVPPETAPPGDPKHDAYTPSPEEIARPPGRLYTVYAVEVIDSGTTSMKVGAMINVGQSGGMWEGEQYQDAGNPPLRVGSVYLLSVEPSATVSAQSGNGFFTGVPFAQFLIEDEALRPLDEAWANLPAVVELTGRTPEQAVATLVREGRRGS